MMVNIDAMRLRLSEYFFQHTGGERGAEPERRGGTRRETAPVDERRVSKRGARRRTCRRFARQLAYGGTAATEASAKCPRNAVAHCSSPRLDGSADAISAYLAARSS